MHSTFTIAQQCGVECVALAKVMGYTHTKPVSPMNKSCWWTTIDPSTYCIGSGMSAMKAHLFSKSLERYTWAHCIFQRCVRTQWILSNKQLVRWSVFDQFCTYRTPTLEDNLKQCALFYWILTSVFSLDTDRLAVRVSSQDKDLIELIVNSSLNDFAHIYDAWEDNYPTKRFTHTFWIVPNMNYWTVQWRNLNIAYRTDAWFYQDIWNFILVESKHWEPLCSEVAVGISAVLKERDWHPTTLAAEWAPLVDSAKLQDCIMTLFEFWLGWVRPKSTSGARGRAKIMGVYMQEFDRQIAVSSLSVQQIWKATKEYITMRSDEYTARLFTQRLLQEQRFDCTHHHINPNRTHKKWVESKNYG